MWHRRVAGIDVVDTPGSQVRSRARLPGAHVTERHGHNGLQTTRDMSLHPSQQRPGNPSTFAVTAEALSLHDRRHQASRQGGLLTDHDSTTSSASSIDLEGDLEDSLGGSEDTLEADERQYFDTANVAANTAAAAPIGSPKRIKKNTALQKFLLGLQKQYSPSTPPSGDGFHAPTEPERGHSDRYTPPAFHSDASPWWENFRGSPIADSFPDGPSLWERPSGRVPAPNSTVCRTISRDNTAGNDCKRSEAMALLGARQNQGRRLGQVAIETGRRKDVSPRERYEMVKIRAEKRFRLSGENHHLAVSRLLGPRSRSDCSDDKTTIIDDPIF